MLAVSFAGTASCRRLGPWPDPECPADGVVVRVGGHRRLPLGLARLAGPRPGRRCRTCPATSSPARSPRSARRSRPGRSGTGSRCRSSAAAGGATGAAAGDTHVCPDQTQPGFTGPGSFAELVAVHAADTNLVRLPDGMDPVTAASLGCRLATAYRALVTHGRLATGDWLAVHGCGGSACRPCSSGSRSAPGWSPSTCRRPRVARRPELGASRRGHRDGRPRPPSVSSPAAVRTCPSTRSGRRRPRWRRCGRCAAAAGTCRSGCCSARTPLPRSRWTGWSPRSCRCTARTACPRTSTPTCWRWSPTAGWTRPCWWDGWSASTTRVPPWRR